MEILNVSKQDVQTVSASFAEAKTGASKAENVQSKKESVEVMQNKFNKTGKDNYAAVSKDGDTLEISENSKNNEGDSSKIIINEDNNKKSEVRMTDAALAKCSKVKLKQLLQNGEISKQQYEKAVKKQKGII